MRARSRAEAKRLTNQISQQVKDEHRNLISRYKTLAYSSILSEPERRRAKQLYVDLEATYQRAWPPDETAGS